MKTAFGIILTATTMLFASGRGTLLSFDDDGYYFSMWCTSTLNETEMINMLSGTGHLLYYQSNHARIVNATEGYYEMEYLNDVEQFIAVFRFIKNDSPTSLTIELVKSEGSAEPLPRIVFLRSHYTISDDNGKVRMTHIQKVSFDKNLSITDREYIKNRINDYSSAVIRFIAVQQNRRTP